MYNILSGKYKGKVTIMAFPDPPSHKYSLIILIENISITQCKIQIYHAGSYMYYKINALLHTKHNSTTILNIFMENKMFPK